MTSGHDPEGDYQGSQPKDNLDDSGLLAPAARESGGFAPVLSDEAILQQRARALAAPVVTVTDPAAEVITFSLNAEGYGIEARYVHEVMYLEKIVPLPGLKVPFIGITNYHGHILPVIDLLTFFQAQQKTDAAKARHLIVLGEKNAELGVIASALGPVMNVAPGSITPPSAGHRAEHLVGMVPGLGILADGGTLLAEPSLWINRSDTKKDAVP